MPKGDKMAKKRQRKLPKKSVSTKNSPKKSETPEILRIISKMKAKRDETLKNVVKILSKNSKYRIESEI